MWFFHLYLQLNIPQHYLNTWVRNRQFIAMFQLFQTRGQLLTSGIMNFSKRWKLALNWNDLFMVMDANTTTEPVSRSFLFLFLIWRQTQLVLLDWLFCLLRQSRSLPYLPTYVLTLLNVSTINFLLPHSCCFCYLKLSEEKVNFNSVKKQRHLYICLKCS